MFLKLIKNFSAKRILKKSYSEIKLNETENKIQTVAVLIDETDFEEKDNLVFELVTSGFDLNNIEVLTFKNKYKKKDNISYSHFSGSDISWLGTIEKENVKNFKSIKFDLLISYYDKKKIPLLCVTQLSEAGFKVGFSSIDSRFNHLMIDSDMKDYKTFVGELVKYLKILKKL